MNRMQHIQGALDISDRLLSLADQEKTGESDDGDFIVLDGVLRDCAYKIRGAVEVGQKNLAGHKEPPGMTQKVRGA